MIRSHAVHSKEAIQEGGSVLALCGKPITKSHWLAFSENLGFMAQEVRIHWQDITCKDCRDEIFPSGYIYVGIEAEEYELLKSKGKVA